MDFVGELQKINVLIPLLPQDQNSFLLASRLPAFNLAYTALRTEDYELIQSWKQDKTSLLKEPYGCSVVSVSISFPHSPVFCMTLAITERMIAIATEWGASMGMTTFSFNDTVFARLGRLSQGASSIFLLEICIDEDFDEVEIFVTFSQREQMTVDTLQHRPPKNLIIKLVALINDVYGGLPIKIRPLCSNCQHEIKTKIVLDGSVSMEKSECENCQEVCEPVNLNIWPWYEY